MTPEYQTLGELFHLHLADWHLGAFWVVSRGVMAASVLDYKCVYLFQKTGLLSSS